MGLIDKLFGNTSESQIKRLRPMLQRVNGFEAAAKAMSDGELRAKTDEFRRRLAAGETLDQLLPEAYAVVREAAWRTVDMRHFDVQILGGIVLHQGRIAEMKTGEGKTLVATLPAYLNALAGEGVHIVTVNDYLARRDAQWMGKIYRFLGLEVGCIVHGLNSQERRDAYNADITYGTNNEFGFDYLRDNMVVYREEMVQRSLNYAIVDEVDSILVDEARTPLIISGAGEESTEMYRTTDKFVRGLARGADIQKQSKMEMLEGRMPEETGDYQVDIKAKTAQLTQEGMRKAERFFGIEDIADAANSEVNHHILQALKAHATMSRDKDYVVQDGQVIIVDEFTGRLMLGRRYSEGLHQALEAKEGVKVEKENKTLATITFQNYFRMFKKLAGMTGTAKTEEAEFQGIYDLDVVEIPTNKPLCRRDFNDVVYTTQQGKFRAVVEEILAVHKTGQPVLVGTVSVEKSEYISALLARRGVKHEVLNAKQHAKEAEIVAQAGKLNTVTIATNMAGRGTDILLGGNPEFLARRDLKQQGMEDWLIEEAVGHGETNDEDVRAARAEYKRLYLLHQSDTQAEHDQVVALGGLHIIGTERHESRRIDNQLRGRAGRQGDPGSTRFYISMEDELMQRFGADRVKGLMERLSPEDDIPIEIGLITKQIEGAQKRVELHNFEIRKNVLQYDDVMNKQREIIYGQRRRVLMGEDISDSVAQMLDQCVQEIFDLHCPAHMRPEEWDVPAAFRGVSELCFLRPPLAPPAQRDREALQETLLEAARAAYAAKEQQVSGRGDMREIERVVLLRAVDEHWMEHIDAMHQLKQGIGLRAYGQRDPVMEYRNEGFEMFDEMVAGIRRQTIRMLFSIVVREEPVRRKQVANPIDAPAEGGNTPATSGGQPGRNDPCPCGSGKKYKHCCGKN